MISCRLVISTRARSSLRMTTSSNPGASPTKPEYQCQSSQSTVTGTFFLSSPKHYTSKDTSYTSRLRTGTLVQLLSLPRNSAARLTHSRRRPHQGRPGSLPLRRFAFLIWWAGNQDHSQHMSALQQQQSPIVARTLLRILVTMVSGYPSLQAVNTCVGWETQGAFFPG